jgi:hypothetical protein
MMEVEEVITASTNQNNMVNSVMLDGMRDDNEDGLLQLKQDIATELVSLLLCVAQVPSSSTAGIKSCAKKCDDILGNIIERVSYCTTGLVENVIVTVHWPRENLCGKLWLCCSAGGMFTIRWTTGVLLVGKYDGHYHIHKLKASSI